MMIFIGADYSTLDLSPEELQVRYGKWFAWTTKMQENGVMKSGEALKPKVKRITGADRTVTDGPFMESKELIGGFYIVEGKTVEDVIEIAQDFPDYDLGGTVEIREVMVFDR